MRILRSCWLYYTMFLDLRIMTPCYAFGSKVEIALHLR